MILIRFSVDGVPNGSNWYWLKPIVFMGRIEITIVGAISTSSSILYILNT